MPPAQHSESSSSEGYATVSPFSALNERNAPTMLQASAANRA
jgi:hypothetical protein